MHIINNYISFKQDNIKLIITKLNVLDLIKITKADIYDSNRNPKGYQRPLNNSQVNGIYEYLRMAEHSILPTAIILAIDPADVKFIDEKSIAIKNMLRIVDGQHRIEALRLVYKDVLDGEIEDINDNEIEEFTQWEYPVNIMLLDKNNEMDRYVEIRSFVDINKKGRKVSTDLADHDLSKIREHMPSLLTKDAVHQICSVISKSLNKDINSVWFQNIKEGDAISEDSVIGMSSFRLSISSIVRKYIVKKYGKSKEFTNVQIQEAATEIKLLIDTYWKEICDKWEDAFLWDGDNQAYRVDIDYNIQKSLGVSALHKLLNHYYTKEVLELKVAMEDAVKIIKCNSYSHKDWKIGSTFSPYTSGSGHNKIKEMLIENSK